MSMFEFLEILKEKFFLQLFVHLFNCFSLSLLKKMFDYADVNGSNNEAIIMIASVTASLSLVMVLVTALLVIRRDRR